MAKHGTSNVEEMDNIDPDLSKQLSTILEDEGITEEIVMARRIAFLMMETGLTTISKLNNQSIEHFCFGSQSEGATTHRLMSDVDILRRIPCINIMRGDSKTWKKGMLNCLMLCIKDYPQHFNLQVYRSDKPKPVKSQTFGNGMLLSYGPVLLSSEFFRKHFEMLLQSFRDDKSTYTAGPSASFSDDIDIVQALCTSGDIPELQMWLDRPRQGNWPPLKLFEEAKHCAWFLVPVGNPSSHIRNTEWRLSPNLIERKLMFSLTITQLKCYILLKELKRAITREMKQQGGEGGELTSFHCKTVLFYTLERTQDLPLQESNLAMLLKLCLQTLQTFLKDGVCPHYIIDRVNLFDGKLNSTQRHAMLNKVTELIDYNLRGFVKSKLDDATPLSSDQRHAIHVLNKVTVLIDTYSHGFPKSQLGNATRLSSDQRFIAHVCICSKLAFERIQWFHIIMLCFHGFISKPIEFVGDQLNTLIDKCKEIINYHNANAFEIQAAREILTTALSFRGSIQAAPAIQSGVSINQDVMDSFKESVQVGDVANQINNLSEMLSYGNLASEIKDCSINKHAIETFEKALETNGFSSRLKLASVMYCSGNLQSAKFILEYAERQFSRYTMKTLCRCFSYYNRYINHRKMFENKPNPNIESKIALCIIFLSNEAPCVPPVLLYEMTKTRFAPDYRETISTKIELNGEARLDARVFMYYLQYLTYGGLGIREKQIVVLTKFEDYISTHIDDRILDLHFDHGRNHEVSHMATALNLLGHCWEMEGDLNKAGSKYKLSRDSKPKHNPADWHIGRLSCYSPDQ
ncbi:uncharacterized protein LOC127856264 [Dreissena polymorpha]|uniref:Mab-21-like HhH/H2TH-like domain-containing protein n=1 Tax=Dreissena polymorpha TaxID=45954 RepID=A0A9D4CFA6_DREPO|nr:uncharacterized protein LOC127856264 [Dreissena polymorpha]KAH3722415.1 hypothetical protein DPMN_065374 [Dreissena polymorpha]